MNVEEGGKIHNLKCCFHDEQLYSVPFYVDTFICIVRFALFASKSCGTGSHRVALLIQEAGGSETSSQVTAVPPGVPQGPLFPDRFYWWRPLAASARPWCEVLPPL